MEKNEKINYRIIVGAIVAVFVIWTSTLFSAPRDFPLNSIVHVANGETLSRLAKRLEQDKVIRSKGMFQFFSIIYGGEKSVTAGEYFFSESLPVYEVAKRIAKGEYHLEPIKVTLQEGITVKSMAKILDDKLPYFDQQLFIQKSDGKEGYLFPDTYFFYPTSTPDEIIKLLSDNFYKKIKNLEPDIEKSGKDIHSIITMASILEGEARTDEERYIISGILWKRIRIGMPIQADATFKYINGKGSSELSYDDLRKDSPYNTYTNKGLPPTPISNPGLASIKAAISPKDSPYLYYLHDKNGIVHYAKTFDEHKRNKARYLQ